MSTYPILEKYAVNLTQRAKNGEFEYADEFDWHVVRIIQVLGRRRNQRPTILNGTPKQRLAIVQGIALKQCQSDILLPPVVKDREIWSLDLTRMFQDAKTPQDLEATLRELVEEWKAKTDLLLFIDNIEQLYGGSKIHKIDFGRWFMTPTVRGEAFGIWGTSWESYKQYMHEVAHINMYRNMIFIDDVPEDVPSYNNLMSNRDTSYPFLEKYADNLTQRAKNGAFAYAEEYDSQIIRAIQVLSRGVVNSPTLIDDSTEKKLAIVQSITLKLLEISADANNSRAYYFSNKEIWSLNVRAFMADHKTPQAYEASLKSLIDELTIKEHTILYIEPAHQVIGYCAELLEPDMQWLLHGRVRRGCQVIWGTDIETYKNCLGSEQGSDKTIFRTKIFLKEYPPKSEFPFH